MVKPGMVIDLPVADEALAAAVSLEDPLATGTAITLQALKERALISLPQGTGIRAALDDGCAFAGFRPRIAFEAATALAKAAEAISQPGKHGEGQPRHSGTRLPSQESY
jgi:LysR substrate binding domain